MPCCSQIHNTTIFSGHSLLTILFTPVVITVKPTLARLCIYTIICAQPVSNSLFNMFFPIFASAAPVNHAHQWNYASSGNHDGPRDDAGPSIPLKDLKAKTNPAEGNDSLDFGATSISDKGKHAIPLDDLRQAIKGIENIQTGSPSKLHNFVATDNGIVGGAIPRLPKAPQLNRSDALKIMDKSEAIEGIFCPCTTYGKVKYELDKAQKSRTGEEEGEEDNFNKCNWPCCSYAAVTILLLCESPSRQI